MAFAVGPLGRSGRARVSALGLPAAAVVVAGLAIALWSLAPPASAPGTAHSGLSANLRGADAPSMALDVTPGVGNAPLWVNLTPVLVGGVSPYNVTVCFANASHTSPPASCGTRAAGVQPSSPPTFTHLYLVPGDYSVLGVATDAQGARVGSTALVVVTNASRLTAVATESTPSGAAPFTVTFNETVLGGTPPITVQWQFGDGTSGSELPGVPITHTYERAGRFAPAVTVTDAAGHADTQQLGTVQVASGPAAAPTFAGIPFVTIGTAFGVFLVPAILAATGVWYLVRRRWRREGEELIEWLENEDDPGRPPDLE